MSDIRTQSDLQQEMAAEFAWRKKELHGVKLMVLGSVEHRNRDMCIRAGVTMLYAHWEGFIKNIGSFYLEFVAGQQLKHEQLSSAFLAMAISGVMHSSASGGPVRQSLKIADFIRLESGARSNLSYKGKVKTRSNLKSSVLQEIVVLLGLDYSRFATKEKLLDERLVDNRNQIAHGKYLLVDFDEYLDLHDEVFWLMTDFYNQVENSAITEAYLAR